MGKIKDSYKAVFSGDYGKKKSKGSNKNKNSKHGGGDYGSDDNTYVGSDGMTNAERKASNFWRNGIFASSAYKKKRGERQVAEGEAALAELQKTPRAKYNQEVAPEFAKSYGRAEYNARMGFTPEEKANMYNKVATTGLQNYRQGIAQGGGGGGQAMLGAINSNNAMAYSDIGAKDAQLQRANMRYADSLARTIMGFRQNQGNLQTREDLRYRDKTEDAYGRAISEGNYNMASALTDQSKTLTSMLMPAVNFGGFGTSGGNKEQTSFASSTPQSAPQNSGTGDYWSQPNQDYDSNYQTDIYNG